MGSGIASLHKVLKDETRRKIILLLQEKGSLSYVDLMKALEITNTGKMNYHLKVLGDLLSKKEDGKYALTEKGTLASRLLLEFPEVTTRQMGLKIKGPQVLWGGIIICSFATIGLFILLRFWFAEFASGYTSGLRYSVPFIFVCAVFLLVGSYMIISDIKKDAKTSRKLSGLTKRKATISIVFFVILGIALIGWANTLPESIEHLTQIGYEENPGASYTVFLEQGQVYRFDIVVANTTELDQSIDITVTLVEENQTWTLVGGTIKGQTISEYFPIDTTGHYEIDWHGLNVTQIIAYVRDGVSPSMSRYILWVPGAFAIIAGIVSFLGLELYELFQSKKTGFFWWGLIIFGLALSWLFGLLWWEVVLQAGFNGILFPFFEPLSGIGEICVSLVLLSIGFYMMRKEAKKESQTHGSASELKISKPKFDLSDRNSRALLYLLASIIINVWLAAIDGIIYFLFLSYINIVGFLLVIIFFGRPHMYGGWFNPTSILPFALLVFGLFVEIFVVCEFVISITKLGK